MAAAERTALDHLSYLGNAATAAYYHRSAALPLESVQPLVYNALSRVILQRPAMGAILHHTVQFIQLRDGRDEEVDALVEEQQNIGFPQPYEPAPCWRLIIAYTSRQSTVSDMVACFVVGEAARDQFCALDFHRSFLAALFLVNEENTSKQPLEYPSRKDSKRLSGICTSRHERETSYIQCQSRFKTVTLGTTDTAHLLVDCFSRTTTLTGAIQAVLAASLFVNLPSEFSTMRTAGHISPNGTIGNPIATSCSRYITTHSRAQGWNMSSIWNEARRIHTASKAELSGKVRSNSLVGFLRREEGPSLSDTKDTGGTSGVSVAVSSMGSFQDPKSSESEKQREWQTGRIISCNDSNEIGAALCVTLVIGGDGCLTMGFSWLEGIVEEIWLDRVIVTIKRLIGELLHTNGATKKKPMVAEPVPWGGSVSRLVCLVRDLVLD